MYDQSINIWGGFNVVNGLRNTDFIEKHSVPAYYFQPLQTMRIVIMYMNKNMIIGHTGAHWTYVRNAR